MKGHTVREVVGKEVIDETIESNGGETQERKAGVKSRL